MARIRTIKPEFWTHEDLSSLPEATHMLAAALLNHSDDEGYFNANPGLVLAACSPLREPSVSVQDSLNLLSGIGYLQLGTGPDGKRYGHILKFNEHQRVNRPTPSKINNLGVVWDSSCMAHAQLTEDSPPERKGKEQGKEEEQSSLRSDLSSPADDDAPVDEKLILKPPVDLTERKTERLRQVTSDAIKAYNARLGKPNGQLAAVHLANDVRQNQVKRCLQIARQICENVYKSPVVTPQFWVEYWDECDKDPFKRGDGPYSGTHANWRPDFEYLTRKDVMTAVFDKAMSEQAA